MGSRQRLLRERDAKISNVLAQAKGRMEKSRRVDRIEKVSSKKVVKVYSQKQSTSLWGYSSLGCREVERASQ
jgi:hypothetical protein